MYSECLILQQEAVSSVQPLSFLLIIANLHGYRENQSSSAPFNKAHVRHALSKWGFRLFWLEIIRFTVRKGLC